MSDEEARKLEQKALVGLSRTELEALKRHWLVRDALQSRIEEFMLPKPTGEIHAKITMNFATTPRPSGTEWILVNTDQSLEYDRSKSEMGRMNTVLQWARQQTEELGRGVVYPAGSIQAGEVLGTNAGGDIEPMREGLTLIGSIYQSPEDGNHRFGVTGGNLTTPAPRAEFLRSLPPCSVCRGNHDPDPLVVSGCPHDHGPESFPGSDFDDGAFLRGLGSHD